MTVLVCTTAHADHHEMPPWHPERPSRLRAVTAGLAALEAAEAITDLPAPVAIVDWDVHHGNGIQDIFWDHPSVLYASIHQWPAYPGTGRAADVGGEHAGGIVNVPLPPRATGGAALGAVDRIIGPAIAAFAPDWVLISAGFDAHRDDPLADLAWTAGDYALLTRRVLDLAPMAGRTIAFLEGGYGEAALTRCGASTVAPLAGRT